MTGINNVRNIYPQAASALGNGNMFGTLQKFNTVFLMELGREAAGSPEVEKFPLYVQPNENSPENS